MISFVMMFRLASAFTFLLALTISLPRSFALKVVRMLFAVMASGMRGDHRATIVRQTVVQIIY